MKTWACVSVVLIGATGAAWFATAYFGPAKLERQLVATAEVELRQIESGVREMNPMSPSAQEIFHTKLPIVTVVLLHTPAPFIFEARSEVRTLPDSGEEIVARYFFTPWRVYQREVLDRRIIISDPISAFTKKEPNHSTEPTPSAVH